MQTNGMQFEVWLKYQRLMTADLIHINDLHIIETFICICIVSEIE